MKRETSMRLLSLEFNSSTTHMRGEAEKAPSYLLTPLGSLVNRVYVCGVLTEVEELESGYRARISDPTGIFSLYSGQFQPEATQFLSQASTPGYVALVGKCNIYEPEGGAIYASLRPERIRSVQRKDRDLWIVRSCELMAARIDVIKHCGGMERNEDAVRSALLGMGYPQRISEGAAMAYCRYEQIDLDRFCEGLREALNYLLREEEPGIVSSMEETLDEEILKIVENLETGGDGGALWEDILGKALERGMDEDAVERAIDQLMDSGRVYEPALGLFRRS